LFEHSRRNEAPQTAERIGRADRIAQLRRRRYDVRHAFRCASLPGVVREFAQHTTAYLRVLRQSLHYLALLVDEIRRREARLDQDASNAEVTHFLIEGLGVAFDGVLGCAIDTHEGRGKKSEHRAEENDAAASRPAYMR